MIIREGKDHHLSLKVEELSKEKMAAQTSTPVQSFGMNVDNITPQMRQQFGTEEKSGVIVVIVEQGSLADIAGIQQGDVVKVVNRKTVRNMVHFNEIITNSGKGEPVLLL